MNVPSEETGSLVAAGCVCVCVREGEIQMNKIESIRNRQTYVELWRSIE